MNAIWPITGGAALGALGVLSYGAFWPRSRLFMPVIHHGRRDGPPSVALTFDDGPHPQATPAVLDILAKHDVRACFFVIGRHAERWPELLDRAHREGHLIANHSFDHAHLGMFARRGYWVDQLTRTDAAVTEAVNERPRLFRPPMGFKQIHMAAAVRQGGYVPITWSRRAMDGVPTTTAKIINRLLRHARAGDILAMHDGLEPRGRRRLQASIDALEPLILGLRQRGLNPVRLDELLNIPAYRDKPGTMA